MENKHKGDRPHRESEGERAPPACRLIGYLVSKFCERCANKKKEDTQERAARITARATIWIALFTFVLAGATIYQGHINSGQLDELTKQRLLTQIQIRANMRRDQIRFTPTGEDGKPLAPGVAGKIARWDINPIWTNAGGTDAKNFRAWSEIGIITAFDTTTSPVFVCPPPAAPKNLPATTIIPPGGQTIERNKTLLITDAKALTQYTEGAYLTGHIEYNDVFPDTPLHHFDWCVGIIPNDLDQSVFSLPRLSESAD